MPGVDVGVYTISDIIVHGIHPQWYGSAIDKFVLTAYRLSDTVKQPVAHFLIHYRSVRGTCNRILSVTLGFLIDFLYFLYWPSK